MGTLVQDAGERLRREGGRMTAQRRLILEELECLDCHPTAEDLYDAVRQREAGINLSTIYRTLRWLEQAGMISARRFDEEGRQERFDPALPAEHHHFVCSACKSVIEFDDPQIENIKTWFEKRTGAKVELASVTLYGLCSQCRGDEHRLHVKGGADA
jgi:Fe2+ or Zn2+ uptake regulation protein